MSDVIQFPVAARREATISALLAGDQLEAMWRRTLAALEAAYGEHYVHCKLLNEIIKRQSNSAPSTMRLESTE